MVSIEQSLFNLHDDPGEQRNVAADHPEEVHRLMTMADTIRSELGDSLSGRQGSAVRTAGMVP